MGPRWFCVLLISVGIASPQSISSDLKEYLSLTDAQVRSIDALNRQYADFFDRQSSLYYQLQNQARLELLLATGRFP